VMLYFGIIAPDSPTWSLETNWGEVSRFSLMRVTMMIDIDVQQDQSDSNPNLA
jgi:hypothetical protein